MDAEDIRRALAEVQAVLDGAEAMAERCERVELQLCDSADFGAIAANATEQLLVYLLLDRLETARFLWRRTPIEVREASASLRAAWDVAKGLWQRNDVPAALRLLDAHADWGAPSLVPLLRAVANETRENELDLVGSVYTTVSLKTVAAYINVAEPLALQVCRERDWGFDDTDGTLLPRPPEKKLQDDDDDDDEEGLDRISRLAAVVTQLTNV